MHDTEPYIEKEYRIPFELFSRSFTEFQRRFVYKSTFLQFGLFLAALIVIIMQLIFSEGSIIHYILIAMCCGFGFSTLQRPRLVKRKLLEAVKNIEDDRYRFRLFDDRITILYLKEQQTPENSDEDTDETKETVGFDSLPPLDEAGGFDSLPVLDGDDVHNETVLRFDNSRFHVYEYDDFFMLYQAKIMYYVVPKSFFSVDELSLIRNKALNNKAALYG